MDFNDVIGQQEAKDRLIRMAGEDKVPHAILFCGPKGSGKMALAMAFASYLLKSSTLEHPDLHFSYPVIRPPQTGSEHKMSSEDFAREWYDMLHHDYYFDLEDWLGEMNAANQQAIIGRGESSAILHNMSLKSSQGGYKISIIWLAEYMNQECANGLLKLLEEPPAQSLFMIVSEQPERLLETIRSRAQRFDIKRISDEDLAAALSSKRGLDEDVAMRLARMSNGSWTDALKEMEVDNEKKTFLDLFILLMRLAYKRDIRELTKWSENVAAFGREKQKRLISYFMRMVRENFMYNFHNPELCYMSVEEEQFSRNFARFINEANVIPINELLQRAFRDIAQNANAKIVFYHLAINMIVLLIRK